MVQSCLHYLLVEQRGWKEGVSSAEKQVDNLSALEWNAYQIELVYFANKKEKHRWEEQGDLSSVPFERGSKEILKEVPAVQSDDPYSDPNSSEIGPPGVRPAEQEGGVSVASRYASAKRKAQQKELEMGAEFKNVVKTLDISAPEAQRVYEAQIRKAERRGALVEKAKAAELLQDANARGKRTTEKVRRELAQEQELRLGLERELERIRQISQDSVSEYELVRAELTQAKTDGTRLAEALAEANGQDGVKMHNGVPEDRAGCLDEGPAGSAKLAYEKERLAEQLVEARVQAEEAERARIGLGEERDREVQLRRESENQARVLDEEVQRLQAELTRAKAQAGSPVSPVVASLTEVEPTTAGTTTTSDILQHYSKVTAAMEQREKDVQLAAEAPHLMSRTKELGKEIAEVRRSQDKQEPRRQPSATVPAQDQAVGDLPAALQGSSTLPSDTMLLKPLPVERVERDDGALSDDSDCRPIQPKLCRRARGKQSHAEEVVVSFKRSKGEQKLTWDAFWEQEKGHVSEAFKLHHKGESSVKSHIKCRYPGCHKRTKTLCSGCGVAFCSPRTTDEQCLEKHRLELLRNILAETRERAYLRYKDS